MIDSQFRRRLATLTPEQLKKIRNRLSNSESPIPNAPTDDQCEVNGHTAFRATSTQARLWFLAQYIGPDPLYNIVRAVRLHGGLNIGALEAALHDFVRRHEVLRSTFRSVEGRPYQVLDASTPFKLEIVDLQNIPPTQRDETLKQQLTHQGRKAFDLTQDCLFRVMLFQLQPQQFVLFFIIHHMVGDGWSLGLLSTELSTLYKARLHGKAVQLSPPSLQFADYAHWLEQQLSQGSLDGHRHYWQKQLSSELPTLDLPLDRARPKEQTYSGRRLPVYFDKPLVSKLKAVANESGASLFMVLLAGFKVLLHRYTRQNDIIVGTPFANRTQPELETVFGYFVDNLPLRSQMTGELSFRKLLQTVRETTLDAYHHAYPLAEILNAIQIPRDTRHPPIFSVMLSLQNTPTAELQFPDIQLSGYCETNGSLQPKAPISSYRFVPDINIARFELSALLKEEQGEIFGIIEYNQDLFDASTIQQLIAHWEVLLGSAAENPAQQIARLPLLTQREIKQLQNWNQTSKDFSQSPHWIESFQQQAQRFPERVAAVFENRSLTYAQLNAQANQLAHYLIAKGIQPDTLIGICVDRSTDMLVGLLGILKAGAAFVPLDPDYPAERLRYMLSDAGVTYLLTQSCVREQLATAIPDLAAESGRTGIALIIELDRPETFAQFAENNLDLRPETNDLAYVIYTSGSTGKPKGVMVEHGNLQNLLLDMQNRIQLEPGQTLLAVSTLGFDIANLELFAPLMTGAEVEIAPRELVTDGDRLKAKLESGAIDVMQATPATWKLLQATGWRQAHPLTVLCGGEALSEELGNYLQENSAILNNAYGPTETTVYSTAHAITTSSDNPKLIGQPLANTRIYIVGDQLQLQPIGVPGELCIAGDGVARGYLNNTDLTEEKFLEIDLPGSRECIYKTGDLARWRLDGTLEYLGRMDHQIKLRGFRIELGEIETTLRRQPDIEEAIVVLREHKEDQSLTAYIQLNSDISKKYFDVSKLLQSLKNTLPEYMIPASFTVLDKLPLTPNGKINRNALPAPDFSGTTGTPSLKSETERQLASLWSALLPCEIVNREVNFFEHGGHSLLATQLVSRIRELFNVELPLRSLFEYPVLKEMGNQIDNLRWVANADSAIDDDNYIEGEI